MKQLPFGRVIFISSIAGLAGSLYTSAYCASKHGVIGMMRALALELANTQGKLTANAICPGFVETDMAARLLDGPEGDGIRAQSPFNRVARPEELAKAVYFLASAESEWASGAVLDFNGASYLRM